MYTGRIEFLTSELVAGFVLSTVVEPERSCTVLVTTKKLHLAPVETNDNLQCGTKAQPWIFEAPAGQRIAISVIDFSSVSTIASVSSPTPYITQAESHASVANDGGIKSCAHHQANHRYGFQYGYLIDKAVTVGKKNVSLCGGAESMNETMFHVSTSNSIELVLLNIGKHSTTRPFNFLISFQGEHP
jgi:hypothetical protein